MKGLPEVISPYLKSLIERTGGAQGPIGLQFLGNDLETENNGSVDPFREDEFEVAPGLVYKYRGKLKADGTVDFYGRALWTVTRYCASYCRFCFRGREVGVASTIVVNDKTALGRKGMLTPRDIDEVFAFIRQHQELNEVILSGGDPFTLPSELFAHIIQGLARLQTDGHLDIVRIGTRLPIQNPLQIDDSRIDLLCELRNPYVMLHVNHPSELTDDSFDVLYRMRKNALATVLSHTVLLKGVNDSVVVLQELFEKLTKEGIRPYYLFQNDPVYWAKRFTVPFEEAVAIWKQLRPRLSGIASTVKFTIESEGSFGKIPVPEGNFWEVDTGKYQDFKGEVFET